NAEDIWFLNNTVFNSERGINSTGVGTDCYLIGNVVYNCYRGIYLDRGGLGTYHVLNNTVDHCTNGIITSGTITALRYRNNIVSDIQNGGYHLQLENSSIADRSTAQSFIFYQPSGSVSIRWASSTYSTLSAW